MKEVLVFGAVALLLGATAMLVPSNQDELHLTVNNQKVDVEIANTSSERQKGLMYRHSLNENHGMLFIFSDEEKRSFWMKNTYIPLDIIFISSNGTVIDIDEAKPQPNTPERELKRYPSDGPAQYVLEVKQGFSRENNITKGSQVLFGEELSNCCVKAR